MGVCYGDQIVVVKGQVQTGLIAQVFHPFDQRVLPLPLQDLFRAQANLGRARRGGGRS